MPWNKEDRSFKTLINRETTDSDNKNFFNEFGADTVNVHADDVWADTIPFNDPATAVSLGRATLETLFVLTEDLSVPNSQSWKAGIRDWISPKFGSDFEVKLFDGSDNEIFTTDPLDWFFDYQTGILAFNGTLSRPTPLKVTGYRYTGTKGVGASSGTSDELQGNVTLTVNASTGSDTPTPTRPARLLVGDYSLEPFATIQAALDVLPRCFGSDYRVIINVAAGNYAGFDILGFTGGSGWYPGGDGLRVVGEAVTPTLASGPTSGTFTSATGKTATLTAAGWTIDDLVGHRVSIVAGAGAGQSLIIAENSTDTLTFAAKPSPSLSGTSQFVLLEPGVVINSVDPTAFFSAFIQGCTVPIKIDGLKLTAGSYGLYAFTSAYVYAVNCVADGTYYGFAYQNVNRVLQQHLAAFNNTEGVAILYCVDGGNGSYDILVKDPVTRGFLIEKAQGGFNTGVYIRDTGNVGIHLIGVTSAAFLDFNVDGASAGVQLDWSTLEVDGLTDLSNCTNWTFYLRQSELLINSAITGTGNTGWGLDLTAGPHAFVWLDASPTISGSAGEVTVDGTTDVTWANLSSSGDSAEGPKLSSIVRD